jgi:hypothetical protein
MLIIETSCGNFAKWSDILFYMLEEGLTSINVIRVEYCLDEVYGKGIYTLQQVEQLVNLINNDIELEGYHG